MKTTDQIKAIAYSAIKTEAQSIGTLLNYIDDNFSAAVQEIYQSKGRVIVTGVGKSAIIAQKITATFNSTGTPSVFMHAADAVHGDLGIIQNPDIIICVSKSGNTPEIKVLVPLLKNAGNKLIALVGNVNSYLAQQADYIINCTVEKEACPNNLAPTSSTTAQLVMGDALAICLLECRDFNSSDFARFHPGGALGKKLYLKVGDLAALNQNPKVNIHDSIKKVIVEISSKRLGATAVLDNEKLVGIITDGDIRRMMERYDNIKEIVALDIMSNNPKTIDVDELAINALSIMQKSNISQIIVTKQGAVAGFVHLHDLLKEGII
ncbi:MAG: KpsF/GutQ family sugar-phosphate isomerase [Bacteroidia bacterium]|nr:KpsF/GutQ family sugar-phosphate isomerase [Bacteroidia bacterium]MCZ2247594.1 KpsF/GutQ family sugar-phosphate isomerase [Bacteroidia bacterium]